MKFKQKAKMLFLDKEYSCSVDPEEKYHVVLSPTLYWVKKVKLPLKYAHEVKKITPTLFEDTIPIGNYNYFVYKEGEEFVVIAYEDSVILSLLAEKGVSLHQVTALSFAQSSFKSSELPLRINEEYVVALKDEIVVLLPAQWFLEAKDLKESDLLASKQTITLEQFSHIVDHKTLYTIIVVLLLFVFVLVGEYLYFSKEKKELEGQKAELFEKYHLKPTLMQNSAILQKYKKGDLKEEKLRKYISYFLNMRLKKDEKIISMEYDGDRLKVLIKLSPKSNIKRLLSKFYKEKIDLKKDLKKDNLSVEVLL
jgi:hypothetical protein